MRIIVSRLPADKQSPEPIINPLATQQDVGTELGKAFIYNSFTYNEYVIRMPYRGPLYPAQKVAVHDETLGESFVAVISAHEVKLSKADDSAVIIQSILTVKRILINE